MTTLQDKRLDDFINSIDGDVLNDAFEDSDDFDKCINDAFNQLVATRMRLHQEQNALSYRQHAYDDMKRDMILGGHVIGKNETEREMKLADLMRVQIAQLRDAQRAERTAQLNFDIARDNVERLKLLASLNN